MAVRDWVAPAALDAARVVRDAITPHRRQAIQQRLAHRDELAARVSPSGLVLGGPFAGVRFPLAGSWGGFAARLAGTYELEIQPHIIEAVSARPSLVIDIGAAEGYYAVGIARALPRSRVIAYDLDWVARRVCRRAASLNSVPNLVVRGRISVSRLAHDLRQGAFVLCDVEGYEAELLDPSRVPQLRNATIICELHDFAVPGVTDAIQTRFSASHLIEMVPAQPRDDFGPPQLQHLAESDRRDAVREGRPADMRWAVMVPRGD